MRTHVGKRVQWDSTSNGTEMRKFGTAISFIPSETDLLVGLPPEWEYRKKDIQAAARFSDRDRYIVAADAKCYLSQDRKGNITEGPRKAIPKFHLYTPLASLVVRGRFGRD